MDNPIIYLFLNKDLHMSVGKAAAQAAHAIVLSMADADADTLLAWQLAMHKTIIVLEARDENHMKNIQNYLGDRRFTTYQVVDEGVNEIDPHVWTALSSPILEKDNLDVAKAFSTFKLYRDMVRITTEFSR